jgi:DNA repair protein RecO (recombination protein O)
MKPKRTEAIVLHTIAVRERDKLVVFLTPEHGKRKGWAYGARGARSRFGASLEPLAKINIGFIEKESEEVVRIESVDLIRSLFPAQQNLLGSIAATYIAETVDTFAIADDPSELISRLLDRTTEALLEGATPLAVVAYAEVWILRLTGILPSLKNCIVCDQPLARPLRYDARVSGFVCENCTTRDAETIANDVADALDAVMKLPVAEFAARGESPAVIFELRSLAGALRRHFLGHELKSFDILASLAGSR